VIFEIWDTESRNLLGDFDSEDAALALVRDILATNGAEIASTLALVSEDTRGQFKTLAHGTELLERARSLAA
jgi:hypothetical protein